MSRQGTYLVKQLAELAGISVRALHHYDELGLLSPRGRTDAGYRLYDDQDVLRLQQILIGRALGLSLERIRRSLDDPGFDRKRALVEQRAELEKRAQQTQAMLHAIDRALSLLEGKSMDPQQLFDGFEASDYREEAEHRWGETEAYKESARRTQSYSAEDWQRFRAEQTSIYEDAYRLLAAGIPPGSPDAMNVAERHRQSIERWFYPCGPALHRELAGLYGQDPRYAQNIDKYGAGLTPFLTAAIRANAARP